MALSSNQVRIENFRGGPRVFGRETEALMLMMKSKETVSSFLQGKTQIPTQTKLKSATDPIQKLKSLIKSLRAIYDENSTLGSTPKQSEISTHVSAHLIIRDLVQNDLPSALAAVVKIFTDLTEKTEDAARRIVNLEKQLKDSTSDKIMPAYAPECVPTDVLPAQALSKFVTLVKSESRVDETLSQAEFTPTLVPSVFKVAVESMQNESFSMQKEVLVDTALVNAVYSGTVDLLLLLKKKLHMKSYEIKTLDGLQSSSDELNFMHEHLVSFVGLLAADGALTRQKVRNVFWRAWMVAHRADKFWEKNSQLKLNPALIQSEVLQKNTQIEALRRDMMSEFDANIQRGRDVVFRHIQGGLELDILKEYYASNCLNRSSKSFETEFSANSTLFFPAGLSDVPERPLSAFHSSGRLQQSPLNSGRLVPGRPPSGGLGSFPAKDTEDVGTITVLRAEMIPSIGDNPPALRATEELRREQSQRKYREPAEPLGLVQFIDKNRRSATGPEITTKSTSRRPPRAVSPAEQPATRSPTAMKMQSSPATRHFHVELPAKAARTCVTPPKAAPILPTKRLDLYLKSMMGVGQAGPMLHHGNTASLARTRAQNPNPQTDFCHFPINKTSKEDQPQILPPITIVSTQRLLNHSTLINQIKSLVPHSKSPASIAASRKPCPTVRISSVDNGIETTDDVPMTEPPRPFSVIKVQGSFRRRPSPQNKIRSAQTLSQEFRGDSPSRAIPAGTLVHIMNEEKHPAAITRANLAQAILNRSKNPWDQTRIQKLTRPPSRLSQTQVHLIAQPSK